MPIFEYECRECGEKFEELVSNPESTVSCPKCGSDQVGRMLSVFASGGSGSGGGGGCSAGSGGFT